MASTMSSSSCFVMNPSLSRSYSLNAPVNKNMDTHTHEEVRMRARTQTHIGQCQVLCPSISAELVQIAVESWNHCDNIFLSFTLSFTFIPLIPHFLAFCKLRHLVLSTHNPLTHIQTHIHTDQSCVNATTKKDQ